MQAYFGKITRISKYFLSKHLGSEPATSASPPVLIKGTASDVANRIFSSVFPSLGTPFLFMIILQNSSNLKTDFYILV